MFHLKLKGVSKIGLGAIGGVVSAIFGALCGWLIFPALVAMNVDKQTVLQEGTEQFERWVNLPQPLHFKVFIFNVTNPKEVIEGAIPKVKEVGPYVYWQYRRKNISTISSAKDLIVFRTNQVFKFDKEASAPLTEDDNLVVLNVQLNCVLQIAEYGFITIWKDLETSLNDTLEGLPIISTIRHVLQAKTQLKSKSKHKQKSVLQMAESTMPPQLGILNTQLKDVFGEKFTSVFMTVKPSEFLFDGIPLCVRPTGIASIICSVIKSQKPKAIATMSDGSLRFSMFGHKNNTDDGLFEMYTGVGNINKLGIIRKWMKRRTIKTWLNATDGGPSTCNMINGTDTTVFPPRIDPNQSIYIFSTDICRSVKIDFKGKVEYAGIPAYHFETTDDFLRNIGPEFGNECFCVDRIPSVPNRPNGCLHRGAVDLSNCQGGPIVITLPHMLGTAAEYQTVDGLQPDPNKHLIFADIEPNTGYPVRGAKRLQLNMFLKKINQIDVTEKLKTSLFPILWVEEGINLNEDMQSLIKSKLIIILLILDMVFYLLLFGGLIAFLGCSFWYLLRRSQENKVISLT